MPVTHRESELRPGSCAREVILHRIVEAHLNGADSRDDVVEAHQVHFGKVIDRNLEQILHGGQCRPSSDFTRLLFSCSRIRHTVRYEFGVRISFAIPYASLILAIP